MRFLILLMLFVVLIVPASTQAAPVPCDDMLFDAGVLVALSGVRVEPNHWQLVDLPYTVDYQLHKGVFLSEVIEVKRGARVVGIATAYNGEPATWSVCRGGNGWKNYLLNRAAK